MAKNPSSQSDVLVDGFVVLNGGYIALDEYPTGGSRVCIVGSKTGDERVIAPDAPAGHILGDSERFGAAEEAAPIDPFLLDQAGMNPGNKTASAD